MQFLKIARNYKLLFEKGLKYPDLRNTKNYVAVKYSIYIKKNSKMQHNGEGDVLCGYV
jgi:hypothetical protein